MDEEEDWDAPEPTTPKTTTTTAAATTTDADLSQRSNNALTDSTPQTLKITDGYKYSYEALFSPANIEDWLEPLTFGNSQRAPNAFFQNSFRENNRPYNNERKDNYKRFDKRNDNYENPSGDFATSRPNRFSNKSVPNRNDWDAPPVNNLPATPSNGLWNDNVSVPTVNNPIEEDWDAPAGLGTPHSISNHQTTPIPMFNQNNNARPIRNDNVVEEENWDDEPSISTPKANLPPPPEIPMYRPSSVASGSIRSVPNTPIPPMAADDDEENWDEPGTPRSNSQVIIPTFQPSGNSSNTSFQQNDEENWDAEPSVPNNDNGFAKNNLPTYPTSSNDSFSNNQRYENNWHSNKYPRSRNFDSDDHFRRDPYPRNSRDNFRNNNSFERGNRSRGRGDRGGRGRGDRGRGDRGRGDRDFNSSFNSRGRNDRRDSYSRQSNDRSFLPPPVSFNNTVVDADENWDEPSSDFTKPPAEKSDIVAITPAPPISNQDGDEESWD